MCMLPSNGQTSNVQGIRMIFRRRLTKSCHQSKFKYLLYQGIEKYRPLVKQAQEGNSRVEMTNKMLKDVKKVKKC